MNELREKTPLSGQRSASAEPLSPVAALVRRHDRDRYQTVLFAPAARREALFALYAFNYEIARVRERVSQPTLGRIRLEWWRENVAAAYGGGPRRYPVVEALTAAIRQCGLDRVHFERLLDARESDFDEEPPADLAALEAYAEGTSSRLIYLALQALGADDAAAVAAGCHIGIAYALSGLMRALPLLAAAGRPIIPAEIAVRYGLDPGDARGTPELRGAVAEIAAAARTRLGAARALGGSIARTALPALLPAVIAARALRRLEWANYDPFDPVLARPDALQIWRLATAALRRRF